MLTAREIKQLNAAISGMSRFEDSEWMISRNKIITLIQTFAEEEDEQSTDVEWTRRDTSSSEGIES